MESDLFEVLIHAGSVEELRSIRKYDLDIQYRAARKEPPGMYTVPGVLAKSDIDKLRAAGYRLDVVRDVAQVAKERRAELSSTNRFAAQPTLFDASLTVSGYLTNEEIDAAINSMVAAHPTIATRITLPNKTWEGRQSLAVRLRAGTKAARPGVLFTGSMHAREWGGADICVAFMLQLVGAYVGGAGMTFGGKTFSASQVKTILENLDVFVFPNVNPDGKHHSQYSDLMWRKNRNPNGSGPAGVDVNRNFDFLWSSGIGTSSSKGSETYRGAAAFSEPEARNVKYMLDAYPSIRYYVDIHSYSGLILYSWGDDENQGANPTQNFLNAAYDGVRGAMGDSAYKEFIPSLDENTLKGLAGRMRDALHAVRGKSYSVEQSMSLYATSATSNDYAYSRSIVSAANQKVYGFAIEFGDQFVPPIAEMDLIKKDVGSAMTELCWAVCSDLSMEDNTGDTGTVPSVSPFWNSPDVWVRNLDDGGIGHQNTIRGQDNYVYVRVRNRGMSEAQDVTVRVYITAFAGTEFVHPNDWVPLNPGGGGTLSAAGTYLVGQAKVAVLSPGTSQIVKVKWAKTLIPSDPSWHPCLLAEVSPNDGPRESGAHVWDSNNLAQKNITIVDPMQVKQIRFPFLVGNPASPWEVLKLEVRKVKGPSAIALTIALDPKAGVTVRSLEHFTRGKSPKATDLVMAADANVGAIVLAPGKLRRVPLVMSIAGVPARKSSPLTIEVVQQNLQGQSVGGVIYQLVGSRALRTEPQKRKTKKAAKVVAKKRGSPAQRARKRR
jgi:carboxypeptidase T